MLDILLWVLFLTVVEGGMVILVWWLWKLFDKTDSEAKADWCICGFIFTIILAAAVGVMLVASAVLGTIRLFGMYA